MQDRCKGNLQLKQCVERKQNQRCSKLIIEQITAIDDYDCCKVKFFVWTNCWCSIKTRSRKTGTKVNHNAGSASNANKCVAVLYALSISHDDYIKYWINTFECVITSSIMYLFIVCQTFWLRLMVKNSMKIINVKRCKKQKDTRFTACHFTETIVYKKSTHDFNNLLSGFHSFV